MPFADISQNASVNLSTSEYGTPRLVNIKIVLCLYVKIGHVTCDFQKMYCMYKKIFFELRHAFESLDSTTFMLLNILGIYLISDEWTKVEANL